MDKSNLTKAYMHGVILIGTVVFCAASALAPVDRIDVFFAVIFSLTIGIGSRITVRIPSLKSQIAVSDTFIFLALILYGGALAVLLASIEAFFSSWRFCNKKITVFFNMASCAISTACVVGVLKLGGLYSEHQLHGYADSVQDFFIALSLIAVTQFVVNTTLAAIYESVKNSLPIWETWKTRYLWAFITYFVGSVGAGLLVQLSDTIGAGAIIAAFPVIALLFLSYKMYLTTVELSIQQAAQAEGHAKELEERGAALRDSEARFRSAFAYAPIGIGLVSPQGKWLKVNGALCEIFGYEPDELLSMDFQSTMFEEDLGGTLVKVHELLSGRIPSCQMERRYVHKSGRTVWTLWSVSTFGEGGRDQRNLIFQLQDISAKKEAEERLQHDATHDALTGLPNRALFMPRLAEALERRQSDPLHEVSVLFIDLDRFKFVNDSLGHLIGDQLLIGIADRLRECMRPPDIVARLGGDEFIILVEGRYYTEKITRIAERIQRQFAQPFDLYGQEVYSSASIGILRASENHTTSEDVMRDADTAMYQAKRSGRSQQAVFDEDMYAAARETLRLETDLRKAVEKYEFEVQYQPIFSLATGEVEGVEALARWYHPQLGEIPPSKFISLAEEMGLINPLGELVLEKACTEIGRVYDAIDNRGLQLSVNLSCRQFAQPFLVRQVKNILERTGFPATRLKLEITETVFFEYEERAIQMLNELRDLGISIDIDDFGTGYSNLSYLARLPISTLKIDRSFVDPLNYAGANTEIIRTVIAMAKNLGLKVIAEGIETSSQLEALRTLECESGQGFLLARPMFAGELAAFLNSSEKRSIVPHLNFDISVSQLIQ